MMGEVISDAEQVEGDIPSVPGLGLLPVTTNLSPEKTTEQCTFSFLDKKDECKGYEIHMGDTQRKGGEALCTIHGKYEDGCFLNSKTWGTYIHGIFDNACVVSEILGENGAKQYTTDFDYEAFKQEQYDKLANLIRQHTDMEYIYKKLKTRL